MHTQFQFFGVVFASKGYPLRTYQIYHQPLTSHNQWLWLPNIHLRHFLVVHQIPSLHNTQGLIYRQPFTCHNQWLWLPSTRLQHILVVHQIPSLPYTPDSIYRQPLTCHNQWLWLPNTHLQHVLVVHQIPSLHYTLGLKCSSSQKFSSFWFVSLRTSGTPWHMDLKI